jgi:hypothetical protein
MDVVVDETKTVVERKSKTISTKFLDIIRERENLNVLEFLKQLLENEERNPSTSFSESITKFGNNRKLRHTGLVVSKDKRIIKNLFDKLFDGSFTQNPISGKVIRFQNSRKFADTGVFAVTVAQNASNAIFQVNCNDVSSVDVYLSDMFLGSYDLSEFFNQGEITDYISSIVKPTSSAATDIDPVNSTSTNGVQAEMEFESSTQNDDNDDINPENAILVDDDE